MIRRFMTLKKVNLTSFPRCQGRQMRMMHMSIRLEYLPEPKLQFGEYFEHEDAKTGLAEFGPFGKNIDGLHPRQIRVGFVGTRETVSDCKEWITACKRPIESENIKPATAGKQIPATLFSDFVDERSQALRYEKILNRDFVGFSEESSFGSCFQMNERWDKTVLPSEIEGILKTDDKKDRIHALVDLFDANIKN